MKFQSYQEKMDILFETAKFPTTESRLLVTPMKNLSFKELDELCVKDNIIIVSSPVFSFNFSTMRVEEASKPMAVINPLNKPFIVDMIKIESMEKFYSEIWNEKDLFFFYSCVKVSDNYHIRIAKQEFATIERAVKRYEAVVRLNENINPSNSFETIQNYVNSDVCKADMDEANVDLNEIAKELYQTYHVEPPLNQFDYNSQVDRIMSGIETETNLDLEDA